MLLRDFISTNKRKIIDFALEIGVTRDCVQKYMSGKRLPGEDVMRKIFEATHGQVTANDFYDLPANGVHINPKSINKNHRSN